MTVELGNSQLFFAYHLRSAFLVFETQLRELLREWDVAPEHFYVLRCDWTPAETSLAEIIAHAMLPKKEAVQVICELVERGYIVKGAKKGCYSLTSQGASLRTQLLTAYHAQISGATQGLSTEMIEAALSSLLTVQNNIQHV